jgi:hypothetical protein
MSVAGRAEGHGLGWTVLGAAMVRRGGLDGQAVEEHRHRAGAVG